MPDVINLLWRADERFLPPWQSVVDGPSAVGAEVRGKTQDEDLRLTVIRRLLHSLHQARKLFLGDVDRVLELLDPLRLRLHQLVLPRLFGGKIGQLMLSHGLVKLFSGKQRLPTNPMSCVPTLLRSMQLLLARTGC